MRISGQKLNPSLKNQVVKTFAQALVEGIVPRHFTGALTVEAGIRQDTARRTGGIGR